MKTKEKTLSIVFAVLLLLCSCITSLFGVTLSVTGKANTIEASALTSSDFSDASELKSQDENFYWYDGASIGTADFNSLQSLRFAFSVNNTAMYRFTNEKDFAVFYFTVCRVSRGRYLPIYQLIAYCTPEAIIFGHVQIQLEDVEASEQTLSTGAVRLGPLQRLDTNITRSNILDWEQKYGSNFPQNQKVYYEVWKKFETTMQEKVDGFILDSYHIRNEVGEDIYSEPLRTENTPNPSSLYISIDVNSPFSEYCVVAGYQFKDFSHTEEAKWWQLWKEDVDVYNEYRGALRGPTWSVRDVLLKLDALGMLESSIPSDYLEEARNIVDKREIKTVKLSYLKQIGSSPFATRIEKQITVPIVNDKLSYDDVLETLETNTLNLLGATVKAVEFESNSFYKVTYLSSTRVEAKTVDGNRKDYILGLNKSLYWYYKQYVDDGIFEEALIEYMLNDAKLRHPELESYEAQEIYGLWGYVVVPETNSFNSLFTEIFSKPTNFSGTYFHFDQHGTMTKENYNTLLEDYDYGYLSRIWEEAKEYMIGDWTYGCTHYLFYADPKYQAVNIGENGGDLGEEGGAVQVTVKEGVDLLIDGINNNASWWRWTKAIISIVAIGGAIIGVIYILNKWELIGNATSKAKETSKRKKK